MKMLLTTAVGKQSKNVSNSNADYLLFSPSYVFFYTYFYIKICIWVVKINLLTPARRKRRTKKKKQQWSHVSSLGFRAFVLVAEEFLSFCCKFLAVVSQQPKLTKM